MVQAFNEDVAEHEFNIQFWTGSFCLLGWLRLLVTLQVTKLLGPIISTILYMFKDISVFICIWGIVLMGFSMVSVLTFQQVEEIRTFEGAIIYFM